MGRAVRLLAVLGMTTALAAYVQNQRRAGVGYFQAEPDNIVYFVDDATVAGLTNESGGVTISPDSTPEAAIWASMERWNRAPHSIVRFAPPLPDPLRSATFDRRNLITFSDTATNRSVTQGTIAVTRLFSDSEGRLTDTDIVFNPDLPFSTTLVSDAFDIEGTLAHELGHVLGLDHSGVTTATMFATTVRGSDRLRTLSADDAAFVADFYPAASATVALGEIRGRIERGDGTGVGGAAVGVVDPARNVVVGAISEPDGGYRLAGLPPGDYFVYAEPLDGPAQLFQLSFLRGGSDDSFRTRFHGVAGERELVEVTAGGATLVDIRVEDAAPTLNVRGLGASRDGEPLRTRLGATVERGGVYDVEVFGTRVDEVAEAGIVFLGSGVALTPGSLETLGTIRFGEGPSFPVIGFEVTVETDAPAGAMSVLLELEGEASVVTGGVEVVDSAPAPAFSADGVTNAASFRSTSIAPGEILSIFGADLGPGGGVTGDFDPLTGRLTPLLAGVTVLFNGVPGAMFFAQSGQLNVQAPTSLTPGGTVFVEVLRDAKRSVAVGSPVAESAPGIFVFNGGPQAVALNQDGSLNGLDGPAESGEVVVLFATGQGAVDPPLATGEAAGFSPLSRAVGPVRVFVGGVEARVEFAGMAPGFVGLLQVNVTLGAGTPAGDRVAVQIHVGGAVSAVGPTLAVR